ncbi:MAG: S1C family serine protease [Bacillota bacterium]
MKKILLLSAVFMMITMLTACTLIDYVTDDEQDIFQDTIMDTRDYIRTTNVSVQTTVFSDGVFNRVVYESQGSGVLYDQDEGFYYVLTNNHVISDDDQGTPQYEIYLTGEDESKEAELVFSDEAYDLAVLRFTYDDALPLINIYTRLEDPPTFNEFLLAVGSPSRVDAIVTYGEFVQMMEITEVDFDVIYHTALIYKGNSGGALVDLDGNLLGINTWGSSDDNAGSLSIPLTQIHEFLTDNDLLFTSEE